MLSTRVRMFGLVTYFLISSSVTAQERVKVPPRRGLDSPAVNIDEKAEQKAEDTAEKPASTKNDEIRFNVFGDKNKFTRFGGWGGVGGAMGQWGMARSMLINLPAVQEELALTADQKKALRDWQEEMRDRGRQMGEQMRAQGEATFRQMNVAGVVQMMGQFNQILQENERGVAQILDKDQRRRLDQISLQMEGITALLRPDVAKAVKLNDDQIEQIQLIVTQSRFQQIGHWMQQGMAMRNARGREGAGEANGPAQPEARRRGAPATGGGAAASGDKAQASTRADSDRQRPATDDPDDEEATRLRRIERMKEFQTRFDEMRTGADEIQAATVERILKVLVPRQRSAFDRMLGPPFDPDKVLNGLTPSMRGDRDGAGGGPAQRSGVERPATSSRRVDN